MSKLCCITSRIRFIINEAEKLMKESVHEEYLFIVQDALVLMTAKETINWIIKKRYLHRWLLPFNGLQYGIPYVGRHVGNSPESTTLDNLLSRDILQSFHFHSILSCYILDGEGTKQGGKDYALQLINTKENIPRTEAYMVLSNGKNTFFSQDY